MESLRKSYRTWRLPHRRRKNYNIGTLRAPAPAPVAEVRNSNKHSVTAATAGIKYDDSLYLHDCFDDDYGTPYPKRGDSRRHHLVL